MLYAQAIMHMQALHAFVSGPVLFNASASYSLQHALLCSLPRFPLVLWLEEIPTSSFFKAILLCTVSPKY